MKSALSAVLKPKILVPAVFAIVLLGVVLSLGDIKKVGDDIVNFPRGDAALFFLLMVLYEIVRGIQWLYFLDRMKVKVGRRRGIFAFVGGEATKSLPGGNYFQNYLLEREKGVAVAYTASGTTITVLLEVVVCVVYLSIVGISGWAWLRPVLIIGTLALVLLVVVIVRLNFHAQPPSWLGRRKFFQWATEQGKTFAQGARTFVTPKSLGIGVALAAVYLAAAGTEYFLIIRGIAQLHPNDHIQITYWNAMSAYLFSLGVGLILPVPTDIGVQEITGVGALVALGMMRTDAVSVSILFRILNLVSSLLIAAVTFVILRRELGDALSSNQGSGKVPDEAATGG